jgi:gas vesicle protein
MNNQTKLVTALLAGVGAGVVIGLMIAPDEGGTTRRNLVSGIAELAQNAKQTLKGAPENTDDVHHIQSAVL